GLPTKPGSFRPQQKTPCNTHLVFPPAPFAAALARRNSPRISLLGPLDKRASANGERWGRSGCEIVRPALPREESCQSGRLRAFPGPRKWEGREARRRRSEFPSASVPPERKLPRSPRVKRQIRDGGRDCW